jgi:hypothetical protein
MATHALEGVMERVCTLSPDRQETIAALILEELTSEEQRDMRFNRSIDKLSVLADEALDEDDRGETLPLSDSLV